MDLFEGHVDDKRMIVACGWGVRVRLEGKRWKLGGGVVVRTAFFGVTERLVCFGDFLEPFGVTAFVGVVFHCEFSVGAFDFVGGCGWRDVQNAIVVFSR